jgi:hypothetical protein
MIDPTTYNDSTEDSLANLIAFSATTPEEYEELQALNNEE